MPKRTTDKHVASYMPFRCDADTYDTICKMAQTEHIAQAEALRRLVDMGLVAAGYKQDEDYLYKLIQQAVQETVKPRTERLAAISAKSTQIGSAAYFMSIYMLQQIMPGNLPLIEEAAATSRQLGIEYLKLAKDRDLDEFLRGGANKVSGESPL